MIIPYKPFGYDIWNDPQPPYRDHIPIYYESPSFLPRNYYMEYEPEMIVNLVSLVNLVTLVNLVSLVGIVKLVKLANLVTLILIFTLYKYQIL